MKRSTDRILTTHVGSLPRLEALVPLLVAKEEGKPYDHDEFTRVATDAIVDVVKRQHAAGVDVVSDGEAPKIGYSTYINDRLSGFGGETPGRLNLDLAPYPEYSKRMRLMAGTSAMKRLACIGPVALKDKEAAGRDIALYKQALNRADSEGAQPVDAFMNAVSPGTVSSFQQNQYYKTHEQYIEAIAEAMTPEYEAIAAAGFVLQVDCPDMAMSRHTGFQDLTDEEFLARAEMQVEALNHALRNVPAEQCRLHICWGNYEGPHDHDIPLERIHHLLMKAKPAGLSFEAANPRHGHEWTVWKEKGLNDDKVLLPGVLDTSTNFIEHPELVAQRLVRLAEIVGKERVIASTDCGFGTFAGTNKVDTGIAYRKMEAMAEGARLASERLWH